MTCRIFPSQRRGILEHGILIIRTLRTDCCSTRHVRYYGDDVAAVVARDEVSAAQAIRAIKVEYEELPFVLDPIEAMRDGAPRCTKGFDHNILAHTSYEDGNYAEAIKEPGLIVVDKWYNTPTVQHCHIENHICYAYEEAAK